MDLKTRLEVLPCGKCEDMIDCDDCLFQKEAKDLYQQIRTEAIDEFLNKARERLDGFMMAEIQGEDMCPFSEIGDGQCPYINQEIGCSYCARQVDIEELEQIVAKTFKYNYVQYCNDIISNKLPKR